MMPKFELFGLTVSTYALMAVLAAITFSVMSWRPLRSCALPLPGVIILLISVCTAFLIGARLWNVAVRPDSYDAEKPWYTLKMSGFSVFGGITGVAVVVLSAALISRIQPLKLHRPCGMPHGRLLLRQGNGSSLGRGFPASGQCFSVTDKCSSGPSDSAL